MELLESPELFHRVASDLATLGYVGEELNKRVNGFTEEVRAASRLTAFSFPPPAGSLIGSNCVKSLWEFNTWHILEYHTPSVMQNFRRSPYTHPMPRVSRLKLPPLHPNNQETNGQRIARLRKERGLTQTELVRTIGLIHHLVSDYEKGKLRLYDEMVARFALALSVSTDELLGLKNGKKDDAKPNLRFMRRMKALEDLPPRKQRTILDSLDLMIQSARNNGGEA